MDCGIILLDARGILDVGGADATAWLHNLTTNDIKALKPGGGCLAAFCTRQGKMMAVVRVMKFPECFLVDVDGVEAAALIAHLQKFIIMERVELKDNSRELSTLALAGPKAAEVARAAGFEVAEARYAYTINGRVLARRSELGVDVIAPPGDASDVRAKLIRAGARPMSLADYEVARIEAGVPRWGADMDETNLPMEAGLDAISYSKGCYVGQEVIQRVKTYSEPPETLVRLAVAGASRGDAIASGGAEVGRVTSAATAVALGYVKKEFKAPGTTLTVRGREATVTSRP